MPFKLEGHAGAVLGDASSECALVVVVTETPRHDDRVRVQILVGQVQQLDVLLTQEQEFICGTHQGLAVDEVSAVDALSLYHSQLYGEWLHLNDDGPVGEDSEHG